MRCKARGIAIWPKLNEPARFNESSPLQFETKLLVKNEQAQELIKHIESYYDEHYKETCRKNKKKQMQKALMPYEEHTDDDGNPTGDWVFKFKLKAERAGGNQRRLKLVDSKGLPMSEPIGRGSDIVVYFNLYGWAMSQVGVQLQMTSVQVVKLKDDMAVDKYEVFEGEDTFETAAASLTEDSNHSSETDEDEDWL